MANVLALIVAHKEVIISTGFFIASELIALNPKLKANSVVQLVYGFLKRQPASQALVEEMSKQD